MHAKNARNEHVAQSKLTQLLTHPIPVVQVNIESEFPTEITFNLGDKVIKESRLAVLDLEGLLLTVWSASTQE